MNLTKQEINYIKDALTCLMQRNTSDILEGEAIREQVAESKDKIDREKYLNTPDPVSKELSRRNVEMAKILLKLGHRVEEEIEMDDDSWEEEKEFIEWDERTTHELDEA